MAEKTNYGKITRLRLVLAQKGVTQSMLADKAQVGVDIVSKLCSGKRTNMMLDTAKRICFTLGCTLDEAFGDDEDDDGQSDGQQ